MPIDVSVIITAFNVERYIVRTIDSVLAQTGIELEIVVIDDCSTDGTWEILLAMSDPRLKIHRLPSNGGPSIARNAGFALASGTWLAVLDGDDIFLPGRLWRCLARGRALKADIVIDNIEINREADGKTFTMFPEPRFARLEVIDLPRFIAGNRLFTLGYSLGYLKPLFRAEFLRRHGLAYDPDLRIGEDYLIMAEALALGAVCAVEATHGYVYTVRAGSISHRLTVEDVAAMGAVDAMFRTRHQLSRPALRAQKRRDASLREATAFIMLVEALKQKDARKISQAIAHDPIALRQLWRPVWTRMKRVWH